MQFVAAVSGRARVVLPQRRQRAAVVHERARLQPRLALLLALALAVHARQARRQRGAVSSVVAPPPLRLRSPGAEARSHSPPRVPPQTSGVCSPLPGRQRRVWRRPSTDGTPRAHLRLRHDARRDRHCRGLPAHRQVRLCSTHSHMTCTYMFTLQSRPLRVLDAQEGRQWRLLGARRWRGRHQVGLSGVSTCRCR